MSCYVVDKNTISGCKQVYSYKLNRLFILIDEGHKSKVVILYNTIHTNHTLLILVKLFYSGILFIFVKEVPKYRTTKI